MKNKAKQTVFWHLGFQKTGTSTLQRALWQNAGQMGIETALFIKDPSTRTLRKSVSAYWERNSPDNLERVKAEISALKTKIEATHKPYALVSDENIIGQRLFEAGSDLFEKAEVICPLIEQCMLPLETKFVFYTRDFEKWLKSAHNQEVKQLECDEKIEDWKSNLHFSFEWSSHIRKIRCSTNAESHFFEMESELRSGLAPGSSLVSLVGMSVEHFQELTRGLSENESLSPIGLRLMLVANKTPLPQKLKRFSKRVVMYLDRRVFSRSRTKQPRVSLPN